MRGENMMPIQGEVVELPIYDTADFMRMGQRVSLFAIPMGGQTTSIWRHHSESWIKDVWETNMIQSGMLDTLKEFTVRDIQVLLYDKDGPLPVFDRTGMGSLWAKSYLTLDIGMKLYWQGPLSLVADPVCLLGGLDALVKMQAHHGDCESSIKMLNYQRDHPLSCHIRHQESFRVQVTPYTPVCRQISVRVVLNGMQLRLT